MVNKMLKSNRFKRNVDLFNMDFTSRMYSYFDPFMNNFESINQDINSDKQMLKSKNHWEKNIKKK